MKKIFAKLPFLVSLTSVATLLNTTVVHAQDNTSSINIVSTGVPFLRISPDPRAGAMGDAGLVLSPDANATFWNSAKSAFATSQAQIGATYTPWLKDVAQDVYLATLAGYYKINDGQAITGGIRYFNLGNIQFTDYSGNELGSGRPREFSLEAGYNQKISDYVSAGVTLRYINSNLASGQSIDGVNYKAGTAVAGDLSIYFDGTNENGEGMTAGATVSNLGSKIGYTDDVTGKVFLPANLGLGMGYTIAMDELNKITFTGNLNHLLVPKSPVLNSSNADGSYSSSDSAQFRSDSAAYYGANVFSAIGKSFSNKAFALSIGAEYSYNDQFYGRAGYYMETKEAGNRKYFTAGVGLKYNTFDINFSYLAPSGSGVTRNPLSNTLRFGIIFDIGAIVNGE